MVSQYAAGYRGVLRELRKSLDPSRKVNPVIRGQYRSVIENLQSKNTADSLNDVKHIVLFLKSQREHKSLLERYNPLFDLTGKERLEATARRVGLNMPKLHEEQVMFLIQGLRRAFSVFAPNHMGTTFNTQILKCDPATISFSASSQPKFSSTDTPNILKQAAHHLCELNETVVFPTETVYGLGAVATNPDASLKIFTTKGRPPDNPLIVHVSSTAMLETLLPPGYQYPKSYQALMKHFWPGPLTLLFPRHADTVPAIITAGQPTVAIRMPSHPVARALIAVAGKPLAAPSANTSGKPSPTRAEHVAKDLNGRVPLIIDGGPCGVGLESTVVDGLHKDGSIRILRPGGITVEQIENALKHEFPVGEAPSVLVHKRDFQDEAMEAAPTTPGMKYRHYSPSVPVTLLSTISHPPPGTTSRPASRYLETIPFNSRVGILAPSDSSLWGVIDTANGFHWHRYPLGPTSDPSLTAHRLFDGLLTLESENVDLILVEEIAEEHEGLAVMNRVRKAAGATEWISYA